MTVASLHLSREARIYSQFVEAVQRDDRQEAARLWALFTQLHSQRPAELVRQMERERGLR